MDAPSWPVSDTKRRQRWFCATCMQVGASALSICDVLHGRAWLRCRLVSGTYQRRDMHGDGDGGDRLWPNVSNACDAGRAGGALWLLGATPAFGTPSATPTPDAMTSVSGAHVPCCCSSSSSLVKTETSLQAPLLRLVWIGSATRSCELST